MNCNTTHYRANSSSVPGDPTDLLELDAKLGFLLGAFKDKIEGEIVKNLDTLLAKKSAAAKKEPAAKKKPAAK